MSTFFFFLFFRRRFLVFSLFVYSFILPSAPVTLTASTSKKMSFTCTVIQSPSKTIDRNSINNKNFHFHMIGWMWGVYCGILYILGFFPHKIIQRLKVSVILVPFVNIKSLLIAFRKLFYKKNKIAISFRQKTQMTCW